MGDHAAVSGGGEDGFPAQAVHLEAAAGRVGAAGGAGQRGVGRAGGQHPGGVEELAEGSGEVAEALAGPAFAGGAQAAYDP